MMGYIVAIVYIIIIVLLAIILSKMGGGIHGTAGGNSSESGLRGGDTQGGGGDIGKPGAAWGKCSDTGGKPPNCAGAGPDYIRKYPCCGNLKCFNGIDGGRHCLDPSTVKQDCMEACERDPAKLGFPRGLPKLVDQNCYNACTGAV